MLIKTQYEKEDDERRLYQAAQKEKAIRSGKVVILKDYRQQKRDAVRTKAE